jgi:hypothetical protein
LDSKGKDALKRIDMFRNVFADPEALTIRITVLRRHRQPRAPRLCLPMEFRPDIRATPAASLAGKPRL